MGRRTGAWSPKPEDQVPNPLTHGVLSPLLPAKRAYATTDRGVGWGFLRGSEGQRVSWGTERCRVMIHVRAVPIISISPNPALPRLTPP